MTTPFFATIKAETRVPAAPEIAFDHWMNPEARQRWEAPPESGMRDLIFDPVEGGEEHIEITHEGQVIGNMHQRIARIRRPELMASHITGIFGGALSLLMQVTMTFAQEGKGTHIRGTSQVCDLTGRDVQAEHSAGWQTLFAAFAADLEQHGAV